tara:strand:- start:82 stop:570 length:489 start_codon:yes stop_codon:yes gene_type:complete
MKAITRIFSNKAGEAQGAAAAAAAEKQAEMMKKGVEALVEKMKPMFEDSLMGMLPIYISCFFTTLPCCWMLSTADQIKYAACSAKTCGIPGFGDLYDDWQSLFSADILDVLSFEKAVEMAKKHGGNIEEMLPSELASLASIAGGAGSATGALASVPSISGVV